MKLRFLVTPILAAISILIFWNGYIAHTVTAQDTQSPASPNTDVGGIITSNTTWSLSHSPYNLISNVQVSPNITLTIEPGVIVNGNGLSLQVWGTLNAVGLESSRIVFNNTRIMPGISAPSTQFLINIQFATVNGGSIYRPTGNAVYGSLRLTDSIIRNTTAEIHLWYPEADCFIERNVFYRSQGISVGISGSVRVYIRNNAFFEQSSVVENWAAYGGSDKMIVAYNSFLSTDRIAVALPSGYSSAGMIGENNFWNTTDTTVIDSMIFDRNDDLGSAGFIDYIPYLATPHPDTPSLSIVTPTPTLTLTPTSTNTPTSTSTNTPTPTSTNTPTSTSTSTPTPTSTNTPTPTPTSPLPPPTNEIYLPFILYTR